MHRELERLSSSESQQIQSSGEMTGSDCIGADCLVMQSHMLMSTSDQCLIEVSDTSSDDILVRDIHMDACMPQMVDSGSMIDCVDIAGAISTVESAVLADIASEFGRLVYDLLQVMPEIALVVAVVSSFLARSGIEHGGTMQEVTRLMQDLQEMCSRSGSVWTYTGAEPLTDSFAGLLRRQPPDTHSSSQPVGIG